MEEWKIKPLPPVYMIFMLHRVLDTACQGLIALPRYRHPVRTLTYMHAPQLSSSYKLTERALGAAAACAEASGVIM